MRIRIPIHPAFLNDKSLNTRDNANEIKSVSKKTEKQYAMILDYMADGLWHKSSEIAALLNLKDTRTKQLMKELVTADKIVDNGKIKGKMYKLK